MTGLERRDARKIQLLCGRVHAILRAFVLFSGPKEVLQLFPQRRALVSLSVGKVTATRGETRNTCRIDRGVGRSPLYTQPVWRCTQPHLMPSTLDRCECHLQGLAVHVYPQPTPGDLCRFYVSNLPDSPLFALQRCTRRIACISIAAQCRHCISPDATACWAQFGIRSNCPLPQ